MLGLDRNTKLNRRHVIVNETIVPYELRESDRARSVRLSVGRDGLAMLVVPKGYSIDRAVDFVENNKEWLHKKVSHYEKRKDWPVLKGGKAHFEQFKAASLKAATARVRHYARAYKLEYKNVTVKRIRSRWGSCSRSKNLNFNYQMLFLPPKLLDYVVVHELCHLKHFNHSRMFWNMVESEIPDYKERRAELKKYRLA